MKYKRLLKKIFTESGVFAAIIAALIVGVYFLGSVNDDFQKENQTWEAKANDLSATINSTRGKYDKVKKYKDLPQQIAQLQSEGGFEINQQTVKNYFNQFRDQYFLGNLHVSMSPVTSLAGNDYKRAEDFIVASEVVLDFDALSDEYMYGLMQAIQQELPGSGKIDKLTLTREAKLTNEALDSISKNGTFQLLKGNIKFTWYGIKSVEKNDSGANASATP